jgi:DNA repair protein RadC
MGRNVCYAPQERQRGIGNFAAAKTLKIELHDHLMIGRGRYASLKALGLP